MTSSAPVIETMTLRPMRLPEDAERLAQMWNASDDQWPGTVSDGVPITAQWVIERHGREKNREVVVWDAGDQIAGFCSLWDWPQEPNVTYIATLNVAPQFQKLGLGRRFLQYYVGRAIAIGSYRLDLHTWPGNLKAVPLYKKCGFFWMPGTAVHMYNFLPTILTMPAAQAFFARHDWYTSLRRELTQAEDDETWEGVKVFTYRFEAAGERLTVWADRESRRIAAVETDELFAAALPADQEPPRGVTTTLRWRITNKRGAPMHVSLLASGDASLAIDHRTTLTVPPGETAELSAPVRVSATPAEQKQDRPTPFVRTLLVIDGQVLELGSGMRPRDAVEVQAEPRHITLAPGVPQTVELRLRSRLNEDVTAALSLAPSPGLSAETPHVTVAIPAGGLVGVPVRLLAGVGGVYELPVTLSLPLGGAETLLPAAVETVFALPPGGVLAARVRDTLRLENDVVRISIPKQGANLWITHRDGRYLADEAAVSAPPAYPNLFHETDFTLELAHEDGWVVATATAESPEHPGFVLRKVVRFGAGPVWTSALAFENRGIEQRRFHVRRWIGGEGEGAETVMPLAAGVTRAPFDIFPGSPDDEMKRPGAFAERWAARQHGDVTVGFVWGEDMAEFEWGHVHTTRDYDVPPGARVAPPPLHWYIGNGDWRAERQLYQRVSGSTAPDAAPAPYLRVGLERPAVALGGDADAVLLAEHRLARPLQGDVTLALPAGWAADTRELKVEGVTYRRPQRTAIRLHTDAAPGAYEGRAALRSDELHADFALPLLRLGDGRAVDVLATERDGQRVLTVDNGRLSLDITPAFGGTLSAIREGGVNHLASPFPRVATLGWMSPWYGGAMPIVLVRDEPQFPGKIGRERFTADPVEAPDARGIPWRGVRQRAVLAHEDLRGVTLEIDALTLGGSPVVKLALRLINSAPASRPLHEAGWLIFVRPEGEPGHTAWTPQHQVRHGDRMTWISSDHWLAAESPRTGRTLALVSARPVSLAGFGRDGTHFKLLPPRPLVPARGTLEITGYLALAGDLAEARRWLALKEL